MNSDKPGFTRNAEHDLSRAPFLLGRLETGPILRALFKSAEKGSGLIHALFHLKIPPAIAVYTILKSFIVLIIAPM